MKIARYKNQKSSNSRPISKIILALFASVTRLPPQNVQRWPETVLPENGLWLFLTNAKRSKSGSQSMHPRTNEPRGGGTR
jgi:hypothetical protein